MNRPLHFKKQYLVDMQVAIEAKDSADAKRRAAEALNDGLKEPGFVVDGQVSEMEPVELTVE